MHLYGVLDAKHYLEVGKKAGFTISPRKSKGA
jgi:hypothetical protein